MAKSCLQVVNKALDMVLLAHSYIYKTIPFYKMQNIKWYIIACIAGCVSLKLPNVQSMWYEMCYFYKKEKREFHHACWHTWWRSFLCLRIMRNKNWDMWWALVWQSSHLIEKTVFLLMLKLFNYVTPFREVLHGFKKKSHFKLLASVNKYFRFYIQSWTSMFSHSIVCISIQSLNVLPEDISLCYQHVMKTIHPDCMGAAEQM